VVIGRSCERVTIWRTHSPAMVISASWQLRIARPGSLHG